MFALRKIEVESSEIVFELSATFNPSNIYTVKAFENLQCRLEYLQQTREIDLAHIKQSNYNIRELNTQLGAGLSRGLE